MPVNHPTPTHAFGESGNGGNGTGGGAVVAMLSGETLSAPTVDITLLTTVTAGGSAGYGGGVGPEGVGLAGEPQGFAGTAGADGTGTITFTNNTIPP
jgi:hypothetical protein